MNPMARVITLGSITTALYAIFRGWSEGLAVDGGLPSSERVVRVLLALSQPAVAASLRAGIAGELSLKVVAEATDSSQVANQLDRTRVDVAVIDGRLAGDALEAVALVGARTGMSAVVLADVCDGPTVVEAVAQGAAGYVLKTEPVAVIVGAIREVASGNRWLSVSATDALVDELQAGGAGTPPTLSPRELQILDLLANGVPSRAIGARLHLSESTIKHHRTNIYSKLGVTSAAAAVYQAMRRGVLQ